MQGRGDTFYCSLPPLGQLSGSVVDGRCRICRSDMQVLPVSERGSD